MPKVVVPPFFFIFVAIQRIMQYSLRQYVIALSFHLVFCLHTQWPYSSLPLFSLGSHTQFALLSFSKRVHGPETTSHLLWNTHNSKRDNLRTIRKANEEQAIIKVYRGEEQSLKEVLTTLSLSLFVLLTSFSIKCIHYALLCAYSHTHTTLWFLHTKTIEKILPVFHPFLFSSTIQ